MRLLPPSLLISALLLCSHPSFATPPGQAYWLWAGLQAAPKDAGSVFLHQGHWRDSKENTPHLITLGMSPHRIDAPEIHLVYRLTTLMHPEKLAEMITTRIRRWESHHVVVEGVQFDFDAATNGLRQYRIFLQNMRLHVPAVYKMSVTGLADWAPNAKVQDLKNLGGAVDHIAFQFYRGTAPVQDWTIYARSLAKLRIPFRVGLLESMSLPPELEKELGINKFYRGTIYFRSLKTLKQKDKPT